MQNYYRLLGVSPRATPPEIEQAYVRQRARFKRLATADRAMKARLVEVEAGYGILSNRRRRVAYDALLAQQPAEPERPSRFVPDRYPDAVSWARRLNVALLACCLLLALDWGLPLRRFDGETVRRRVWVPTGAFGLEPTPGYRVHTEHTTFRLTNTVRQRVPRGARISVWQTPLLKVVRRVWLASATGAVPLRLYGGSIYSTFAVLPLLLGAVAAVGVGRRRSPETVLNTAVVGGLLALIAIAVLLRP